MIVAVEWTEMLMITLWSESKFPKEDQFEKALLWTFEENQNPNTYAHMAHLDHSSRIWGENRSISVMHLMQKHLKDVQGWRGPIILLHFMCELSSHLHVQSWGKLRKGFVRGWRNTGKLFIRQHLKILLWLSMHGSWTTGLGWEHVTSVDGSPRRLTISKDSSFYWKETETSY